ncbi:AFL014Cp [Eremothecium gossypii ATCC 10895]|uniref:AFL014Cp n=1 Tax=Eremothecium gossypii (strain ATCC 10895 / CBS 109.51 / FGSC 9923 / NRRL Y-1056) TaxID=284811 RepID=Q754T5_EREGS|nr:AFL014Cp [Eremothecium gossypii ATCC 10895]AAS53358.1 AFL014Cp [Eremothecium gossypii ATCC 10895]AEY97669.1 FAFL014Cp [Eremothecium gossypii FDAG1]
MVDTKEPRLSASRSMLLLSSPSRLNVVSSDWSKVEKHNKVMKPRAAHGSLSNVTNVAHSAGGGMQRTKLTQAVPPLLRKSSSYFKEEAVKEAAAEEHGSQTYASSDRFIPVRNKGTGARCDEEAEDQDVSPPPNASPSTHLKARTKIVFKQNIAEACGLDMSQRILQYLPQPPQASVKRTIYSIGSRAERYSAGAQPLSKFTRLRKINTNPERILDAPGFQDDFYLNLLSWSKKNVLAIALDQSIYLWNGETGEVSLLTEFETETITSVVWSNDDCHISIGKDDGNTEIWDVETMSHVRTMRSSLGVRICSQDWLDTVVCIGAKSGEIQVNDVRVKDHIVSTWEKHTSEVCGIKFRQDGLQLASGGNDNTVMIWDTRQDEPLWVKRNHNAAVKAITWHPDVVNLLATGGGSLDRHIHFWNTTTGARIGSINTGSQVSSLHWGQSYEDSHMNREIVATGGSPDNSISIYNYDSKVKVAEITQAHESRIVSSQLSPDGTTIATVGGDENLKFYRVFDAKRKKSRDHEAESFLEIMGVGKKGDEDSSASLSPKKSSFLIR